MKISIDPITRLEGHGKIDILLDEKGDVKEAYMQIPELRGFEQFCKGRKAEDMPLITERICGVCPEAHHFASTKALDDAFNVEPTSAAKKIRELLYNAYFFYDHCLHLYYLGGVDLIVGDAPKEERNILGVIKKVGLEIGKEVIKHRRYAMEIVKTIGGREIHPICGVPGGVTKQISEEEREEIIKKAESCVEFGKFSMDVFNKIFESKEFKKLNEMDKLETYYMGIVDEKNHVNFYDGKVRVVDPDGKEFAKVDAKDVLNIISEHVEEWSYVKFPYLKDVGWRGLVDGKDSGIYRVGSLGRLNAADGMSTPIAMEEYKKFKENGVVHSTFGFYQARMIEMMNAAERMLELAKDKEITSDKIRNEIGEPGEGIGVIEAARGTLIHHYKLNEKGLIEEANMIVATTNNNAGINMSVRNAAKKVIKGGKVDDIILNKVESAFRCYDPCLACASHSLPGEMPLIVSIYNKNGLYKKLVRNV